MGELRNREKKKGGVDLLWQDKTEFTKERSILTNLLFEAKIFLLKFEIVN